MRKDHETSGLDVALVSKRSERGLCPRNRSWGEVRPPGGAARLERGARETRRGDGKGGAAPLRGIYRRWLNLTRPAPGPGGLRRPLWLPRAYKPDPSTYRLPE